MYRVMKFHVWITMLHIWTIINIPMGKGMLLNFPALAGSHGTPLILYRITETSALG